MRLGNIQTRGILLINKLYYQGLYFVIYVGLAGIFKAKCESGIYRMSLAKYDKSNEIISVIIFLSFNIYVVLHAFVGHNYTIQKWLDFSFTKKTSCSTERFMNHRLVRKKFQDSLYVHGLYSIEVFFHNNFIIPPVLLIIAIFQLSRLVLYYNLS